jgi:DNA replication and repair protein RecF
LVDHYRVVTMREDDILIVTGYPEERRDFLDGALMQQQPEYAKIIRSYRATLKQRNALLMGPSTNVSGRGRMIGPISQESYRLWTERLLVSAQEVRALRVQYLKDLEQEMNRIVSLFFTEIPAITLNYIAAEGEATLEALISNYQDRERAARRTLFGAHLDDIAIVYAGSGARRYASRGQQKLVALLMKLAQVRTLKKSSICLLDDFMTDFDDKRLAALIMLLVNSQAHLIFTVPIKNSPLIRHLASYEYDLLEL